MVYDLLVTFTGTGTYLYHDISTNPNEPDFFNDVTITFNWTSKYHFFLSEDFARTCAGSEAGCDTGWVSMPEIQVNGTLEEQWKDNNGLQNSSASIVSAMPGSTFVTTALASLTSPGESFLLEVEPFSDAEFANTGWTSEGHFWSVTSRTNLLAAKDILPVSALTQSRITKPVWGGADQIECGDKCTSSLAWVGNLTIEKLAAYGQPGNPAPPVARLFSYQPTALPVTDNPIDAQPIGLGSVADGGNTLDFRVGFGGYPEPLDLYLAVYMPFMPSPNLWMVGPGSSFQPYTQQLVKWKENVTDAVDETIFGSIPTSVLPEGQYYFYLMATPSGSLDSYYLWSTSFTK